MNCCTLLEGTDTRIVDTSSASVSSSVLVDGDSQIIFPSSASSAAAISCSVANRCWSEVLIRCGCIKTDTGRGVNFSGSCSSSRSCSLSVTRLSKRGG